MRKQIKRNKLTNLQYQFSQQMKNLFNLKDDFSLTVTWEKFIINSLIMAVNNRLNATYTNISKIELRNYAIDIVYDNLNLFIESNLFDVNTIDNIKSKYVKRSNLNLNESIQLEDIKSLNFNVEVFQKQYNKNHAKYFVSDHHTQRGSAQFKVSFMSNIHIAHRKLATKVINAFDTTSNSKHYRNAEESTDYYFTIETDEFIYDYMAFEKIKLEINNLLGENLAEQQTLSLFLYAKDMVSDKNSTGFTKEELEDGRLFPTLQFKELVSKVTLTNARKIVDIVGDNCDFDDFYESIKSKRKTIERSLIKSIKGNKRKAIVIFTECSPYNGRLHFHVCLALYKKNKELEEFIKTNKKTDLIEKLELKFESNGLRLNKVGKIWDIERFIDYYLDKTKDIVKRVKEKVVIKRLNMEDPELYEAFKDIDKASAEKAAEYWKFYNNTMEKYLTLYPLNFFQSCWRLTSYHFSKRFEKEEIEPKFKKVLEQKDYVAETQDISGILNNFTSVNLKIDENLDIEDFCLKNNCDYRESTYTYARANKNGYIEKCETQYITFLNQNNDIVQKLLNTKQAIISKIQTYDREVSLYNANEICNDIFDKNEQLKHFDPNKFISLNRFINQAVDIYGDLFDYKLSDIIKDVNDFDLEKVVNDTINDFNKKLKKLNQESDCFGDEYEYLERNNIDLYGDCPKKVSIQVVRNIVALDNTINKYNKTFKVS